MRANKSLSDLHKIMQINTEDFYDALTLFAELPTELYGPGISLVERWLCGLKIELDKFKREVLQIDQPDQNNLHGSDQKREIKEVLNGLTREFSKLLANFFTEYELPPHREKELRSHRDKCYAYLEQLEKCIDNFSGDNHAQK